MTPLGMGSLFAMGVSVHAAFLHLLDGRWWAAAIDGALLAATGWFWWTDPKWKSEAAPLAAKTIDAFGRAIGWLCGITVLLLIVAGLAAVVWKLWRMAVV